jgi:ABC-2 type transport system permease protein
VNGLGEDARAAAAVVKRDFLIMFSYRARFVTNLVSGFFILTVFHFISRLVHVSTFPTSDSYYAYVVIGLITLQVLNSTLASPPSTLRQELVAGTFERFVVSPFGATRAMLATLLFPFLSALTSALAMLIFAEAVFGVNLDWATLPLLVPVSILVALSFAPFGVAFLAVVLLVKQAVSGANFLIAGISLIAGLYFPVSLLPAWMRWMSDAQPFTPAVDLMRHVMVATDLRQSLWIELAKLVGFTAVLMPLAIGGLIAALRVSRRRGTILEY